MNPSGLLSPGTHEARHKI